MRKNKNKGYFCTVHVTYLFGKEIHRKYILYIKHKEQNRERFLYFFFTNVHIKCGFQYDIVVVVIIFVFVTLVSSLPGQKIIIIIHLSLFRTSRNRSDEKRNGIIFILVYYACMSYKPYVCLYVCMCILYQIYVHIKLNM